MMQAFSPRNCSNNIAVNDTTATKNGTPHHRRQVSDDSTTSCKPQTKRLRSIPSMAAVASSPFQAVRKVVGKKRALPQQQQHQDGEPFDDPDAALFRDLAEMEATPVDQVTFARIESGLEVLLKAQIVKEQTACESDEDIAALRSEFVVAVREHFRKGFSDTMMTLCECIDSDDEDASSPSHHLDRVIECATEQALDLFVAGQYLMQQMEGTKAFDHLKSLLILAQNCVEFFMEPHMSYSMPTEQELDDDDAKTRVEDAARILTWIHRYLDLVDQYGNGVLLKSSLWPRRIEVLVAVYLRHGVARNVAMLLERSMKLRVEEDIYALQEGHLVSGFAVEVAYIINSQLKTAKEKLPGQYSGKILAACNKALHVAVEQNMMEVGMSWKEMSVERLCSIINDATHLCDQCEERNEVHLEGDDREAGEALCRVLTELALFSSQQLCHRIILDLQEDLILTAIGDEKMWAKLDTQSDVQRTNLTFHDYFDDLERWLPAYFFPKILKHCFDLSIERYTEAFFGNSMAGRLSDADMAAATMRRDYDDFVSFWCQGIPLQYHGAAGFYSKNTIHQRLSLILSFQRLVSPTLQADDVQEEIDTVLVELGIEAGIPSILHLVGLRGKQDATVSLRWHEVLSKVKAVVSLENDGGEQRAPHNYNLPDLRNSLFLPNVQPPQGRQLQKLRTNHSEMESMDICETSELVKSRRVQRVRQKVGQTARGVGRKIKVGQKIRGVRRFVAQKIGAQQTNPIVCD